jgi:hypothetical protein
MIFNAFVGRIPKNLITINSMIEVLLDLSEGKSSVEVANAEWSGTGYHENAQQDNGEFCPTII